MNNPNKAYVFFENYVIPAVEEWRNSPANQRLAMNAASALNNLVEYFWHAFSDTHPGRVLNQKSLRDFRVALTAQNSNIGLVRDVADSHKHLILSRSDRTLTSAEQIDTTKVGYGQAYGLSYGGGEQIVIELDDTSQRYFALIVEEVYDFWKAELSITIT